LSKARPSRIILAAPGNGKETGSGPPGVPSILRLGMERTWPAPARLDGRELSQQRRLSDQEARFKSAESALLPVARRWDATPAHQRCFRRRSTCREHGDVPRFSRSRATLTLTVRIGRQVTSAEASLKDPEVGLVDIVVAVQPRIGAGG